MYELINILGNTYCFIGPTKIGLYRLNDTEVCIIDSGIDKTVGKRILRNIENNGWKLSYIINTHSHADHIGGNAFLQEKTGCKIYSSQMECSFINYPILESALLYGANSPKVLRGKFLMAEPSKCTVVDEKTSNLFQIINLPGHSYDMIGIKTPDDVLFVGDSFSSPEMLQKHKITYVLDVKEYLLTLEKLKGIKAEKYVPSHAEISDDITSLIELNINKTNEISNEIVKMCDKSISFEGLLKKVFDTFNIDMTHEQNALIGSTLRSYLTYLTDDGKLLIEYEENIKKYRTL